MTQIQMIVALIVCAACAYGGWWANDNHRDSLALAEAYGKAAALEATAKEIAKLEVKNVTINKQAETIIREKPVYQECKNSPEMQRLIESALKGAQP